MNGRPFRIAAAGLCTALMASIVAGVSHFRTESRLIASSETLPIFSATIAAAPGVERPNLTAPSTAIAASDPVALPGAIEEAVPLPVSRTKPRAGTNVVSNIRRKKEFVELPPPPEFLDEPDVASELKIGPMHSPASANDLRVLQEIAALRHEFERVVDQQHAERQRLERQVADLNAERQLSELKSTVDELKSTRVDQRLAMLQPEPPMAVFEGSAPHAAASEPPPQVAPAPQHVAAAVTPRSTSVLISEGEKADHFHFQLLGADLHEVLAGIGRCGSMNLVVSPDVQGSIHASWRNMTPREALEAVKLAHGLTVEPQGSFLLVSTAAEARGRAATSKNTLVQMFRPLYISGRDLLPLIEPLLTPDIGRVAVTLPRTSSESERITGGGDSLAQPDAVIVVDYPEVIEVVTRTIAEIDVPAPHVELEATILDVQLSGRVKNGVGALLASGEFSNRPGFVRLDDVDQLPCDSCCQTCDMPCADVVKRLRLWTDVKLVSNARLLVLNKQPAELQVGTESITMLPTGPTRPSAGVDSVTRLFVRPFVSADHLVRLEVSPEAMTARLQPMNIRRESFASVATNVTVPNGGSLVIAGLNVDEAVAPSAIFQAFGRLRRKHKDEANRATRRELVIMITPRVIQECPPTE